MVYIFGHRNPDTDSVCSSIALSHLKNELGVVSRPKILDDINNETKFVLDYFKVPEPKILSDVRLRIKNINYRKDAMILENVSLLKAYNEMLDKKLTALPIVDDEFLFKGLITMKDIARINFEYDTKLFTSYENIVEALSGEILLKYDSEIDGDILVASYKSTTIIENINMNDKTILIVGDRHSVIEHAVNNSVKLIIVTGDSNIKKEHLEIAKKNNVNVIRTNFDTYKVSRIINFANYVKNKMADDVVSVNDDMPVGDFKQLYNKLKYSNYPVIGEFDKCLGLLGLADLNDKTPIDVILVDHNELSQSVNGIDEANIVEVIDHHKIGDIASRVPINFRNMTVGSSCTIVYLLFKENNIIPTREILGLLLSGIISDTMLLNSPTTSSTDVNILKEIADKLSIDYVAYGKEMFHHGSSLKNKTKEEIIYNDFKNFVYNDYKIGLGQHLTTSIESIKEDFSDYHKILNNIAHNNDYDILAFFVTDIVSKGSYIIFSDNSKELLQNSYGVDDLEIGHYFDKFLSRKSQILPPIAEYLDSL